MTTLTISCATDGILGMVGPLALAAAADTALVVDLDPQGPAYPGSGCLADLVNQGPRRDDLQPTRKGIAVLRNGGVDAATAHDVLTALRKGWPRLVLRLPPEPTNAGAMVPLVPLLPGGMTPACNRPAVYQQVGWRLPAPGPGITLSTPSRAVVSALLEGRLPVRSKWIRSWRPVWERSWA